MRCVVQTAFGAISQVLRAASRSAGMGQRRLRSRPSGERPAFWYPFRWRDPRLPILHKSIRRGRKGLGGDRVRTLCVARALRVVRRDCATQNFRHWTAEGAGTAAPAGAQTARSDSPSCLVGGVSAQAEPLSAGERSAAPRCRHWLDAGSRSVELPRWARGHHRTLARSQARGARG